jgi:putative transposase
LSEIENHRRRWRKIYDGDGHAYFVTFSCYRRRRLLDDDQAKGVVIHFLAVQLTNQQGSCLGFVVMPDHVHALVWFGGEARLSLFMNQWKRRSSMQLKRLYRDRLPAYAASVELDGPMWQPKYYVFNVHSARKTKEKLDYMHNNPVKAGLVQHPQDWPYSSARWYLMRKSVGVPISYPG